MNGQLGAWTVGRVAELVGGTVVGDASIEVTGLDGIDTAEAGDLVFAESSRYLEAGLKSRATGVITTPDLAISSEKPMVLVDQPRLAFLKVLEAFAVNMHHEAGVDSSAVVHPDVVLGAGVYIGPLVSVDSGSYIADGAALMAGVHVGKGCTVGEDTTLFPNVVLYAGVTIGKRCLIHAGAVIGSDGFGYVPVGASLKKIPHIGTVRIEDDVEIGANCCIDRAKTAETVIGAGTKLDNLVHVAHNVRIGKSCLLVSQVGIAGSTTLGHGVILAGQVGVADHVNIGDGAQVGAQSGIRYDIPAGAAYFGSPAVPLTRRMKEISIRNKLPETLKEFRQMQKRVAELESQVARLLNSVPSAQVSEEPDSLAGD